MRAKRKPQHRRHAEAKRGADPKRDGQAGRRERSPARKHSPHSPQRRERAPARKPPPRGHERPAEPAVIRGLDARVLQLPEEALRPARRARNGEWLWTTRPGSERDLCEELVLWRADSRPQLVAPALVASSAAPLRPDGPPRLAFARQGFRISGVVEADTTEKLVQPLVAALAAQLEVAQAEASDHALQVWVPDADGSNPLAAAAAALQDAIGGALAQRLGRPALELRGAYLPQDIRIAQVCLAGEQLAYAGVLSLAQALSSAPGGRERMRVAGDRPSRSARKLEEAFAWAGIAPGRGETCIDLGAAPGGWTWIARRRGARVIAVDPAALRPDVAADAGVRHVRGSAFGFEPDEPVDWLLCDMAWRPLEVASLLARHARRRTARFLIANFKLPMKRKAEMVARLCEVLEDGGFQALRCRQLYHDRDEVTVFARS